MNILNICWFQQGNADQVSIFLDIPQKVKLDPDYFTELKVLKLYGHRKGKLRSIVVPYFQMIEDVKTLRQKWDYNGCSNDLNVVKFKHLIPQVEKHLSWAILSA